MTAAPEGQGSTLSAADDDAALLGRVAAGDGRALAVAFRRFHRDVYLALAPVYGARLDLDDVVQATFLALPRAAHNLQRAGSARAFVLGVALQHAHRARRRLHRRWLLWRTRAYSLELPSAPVDPEQRAIDREQLAAIEGALGRLSRAQREVLIMHEVRGMKGEEIARALGVPVNTVWTRLHHAREGLRASLRAREGR